MLTPACLWNRSRLERYADGALSPRVKRSVEAHLARCGRCLLRVEGQMHLQGLVKSALPEPAEPDWAGFWPGVQARIVRDPPKAIRDPWWAPLWRPVWGHPRLAVSGAMVAALALIFTLWPGRGGQVPAVWAAGQVVVQDINTTDPERAVMVYSTPDQALTVIWLFPVEAGNSES